MITTDAPSVAATRFSRFNWFELVLALAGSLVLLLVLAPLIRITLSTPLGDLRDTAMDSEILQSIWLTIYAAFFATLFSAIAGIPLAYLLARKRFFGRSLLLAAIDLPIVVPHSAAGIALLTVIGRRSLIGGAVRPFAGGHGCGNLGCDGVCVGAAAGERRARGVQGGSGAPGKGGTDAGRVADAGFPDDIAAAGVAWRRFRDDTDVGARHQRVRRGRNHRVSSDGNPVMVFQRFNDYGLVAARSVAVLLILICVGLFVLLRVVSRTKPEGRSHA